MFRIKIIFFSFLMVMMCCSVYADNKDSHDIISIDYRLPAKLDTSVLEDAETEIWAKAFFPRNLIDFSTSLPLVIFLHGNHATCGRIMDKQNYRQDISCEYTSKGMCSDGLVPVPNHIGYDYVAEQLAAMGYWVLSVNANRGITCGKGQMDDVALILARGRLILRHLELLQRWANQQEAFPAEFSHFLFNPFSKIDFQRVGLVGHSRGGEGARAAYNLYIDEMSTWQSRIPNLKIKGIFEIGAVDGQTNRVLDAKDIVWNQLLPMCDGDVSDLQGRYPFDRMLHDGSEARTAQKSVLHVHGANHNFFNTEWMSSDAKACVVGEPIFDEKKHASSQQQTIAAYSIIHFFEGVLHQKNKQLQLFNPIFDVPDELYKLTDFDRDYTSSPHQDMNLIVDQFDQLPGVNHSGEKNKHQFIQVKHVSLKHKQSMAEISWDKKAKHILNLVMTPEKQGHVVDDFLTLDFRLIYPKNTVNVKSTINVQITLIDSHNRRSPQVSANQYDTLSYTATKNLAFKTIRIPLAAFKDAVSNKKIRAVEFEFDSELKKGLIYLADVRFHKVGEVLSSPKRLTNNSLRRARGVAVRLLSASAPEIVPAHHNQLFIVKTPPHLLKSMSKKLKPIQVHLKSDVAFTVMNRLPVLKIGNQEFKHSHYSDMNELKEMVFYLTETEYRILPFGDAVTLDNGKQWQFAPIKRD